MFFGKYERGQKTDEKGTLTFVNNIYQELCIKVDMIVLAFEIAVGIGEIIILKMKTAKENQPMKQT